MAFMEITTTIDRAGRIVLPKAIRDELHLQAGDVLELESGGESVTLRPVRSATPLKKERGVWVFRGSEKLSSEEAIQLINETRNAREVENRGVKR